MPKKFFMKIIFLPLFILLCTTLSFAQVKKWTLEECVNYALKNNIAIKNTELDLQTSAIEKSTAIGNFLPTINANGTHSWNIGLNQNITTGILENQTQQNTSIGLNSGVVLYNGLQNLNRFRRSNLSIIASQYQISKIKDDISLNVANAFLQILFNKENLNVQTNQLANNQKQLDRSTILVEAGSIPRGDLLDIKATIASNQQNVVLAENALFIAKLSLAQLLQISDFATFDVDEKLAITTSDNGIMLQKAEDILQKAKENRFELKIAKANVDLAEKDIIIAKGAFQPRLSAFYSFTTRAGYSDQIVGIAPNTNNPFSQIGIVQGTNQAVLQPNFTPVLGNAAPVFDQFSDYKGHSFGLQLNIPILNGFTVKNNVARSKINLDRTKISQQQTDLDIERNVYTAYANAQNAEKSFDAAKIALTARQNALEYAKERYTVGMMNSFDFNQSQLLFANATSEVLRTKYDYIFKIKIVELYFGIPIVIEKK